MDLREMPKYRCHKIVHALKISNVEPATATSPRTRLLFDAPGPAPFTVSPEYVKKHNPISGGYYIIYEDGYESFSPAEAFEKGYTQI